MNVWLPRGALLGSMACCAVALPLLLALPTVPDAVLHAQLLGIVGWGMWVAYPRPGLHGIRVEVGLIVGALVAVAVLSSVCGQLAAAGVLLGAAAVVLVGQAATRLETAAIAAAWSWAGLGCALIAAVQYFLPEWTGNWLIAGSNMMGRAVGNMRQPNHLATALLCAMVWTAWRWQAGRCSPRMAGTAIVAMVVAVVLSASRTGALSLAMLVLWAWADRSLPRAARWTLAATPLIYGLAWAALAAWSTIDHGHFYAAERLHATGDPSSSRFAIWRNALDLVAAHPWTGVGWGRFNAAWTFTPFSDRPVAFFDHAHNLPLQLAVEIGLPATGVVLGLLGWALWRARDAWLAGARDPGHPARAALVMLAVLGIHSLLEYPLWYAYFLLPTAWALGLFLGASREGQGDASPLLGVQSIGRALGVLMIAGAAFAAWDHRRIEAIFAPSAGGATLAERIAQGRNSKLFGHHADYAAVTTVPRDQRLESFRRPLRQLVDTRLLIAYIEALRVNGREAEALYAAQRLREFQRPDAQAYFKGCEPENPLRSFQCSTQAVNLDWKDLLP